MTAEERIPEEQRGVTEHWFTTFQDASAYVRDMEEYCTQYAFKLRYTLRPEGRVFKVTLWIKDD
jgi:hypothetical protein